MGSTGYGPRGAFDNLWHPRLKGAYNTGPQEVEGAQVHEIRTRNTIPRCEVADHVLRRYELDVGNLTR